MLAKETSYSPNFSKERAWGDVLHAGKNVSIPLLHVTYHGIHTSSDQESSIHTEKDTLRLGIVQLHYTYHLILLVI